MGAASSRAARTRRPPSPPPPPAPVSLVSIGAPRDGRGRKGAAPARGSPPPRSAADPRRGRQVCPGCRSLCLQGSWGPAARGEGRGGRQKQRSLAESRSQDRGCAGLGAGAPHQHTAQAGVAGCLTLASHTSPAGVSRLFQGWAHSPASGDTQPTRAQSPSRARTPRLVHSRHPGRAQSQAPSLWRVRPGPGAHTLRGTPTAAAAGLARRRPPRLRPWLPAANTTGVAAFARGEKKTLTRRGLRVCRKGQPCETQGEGLSFDKLEKPLDRV